MRIPTPEEALEAWQRDESQTLTRDEAIVLCEENGKEYDDFCLDFSQDPRANIPVDAWELYAWLGY